MLLAFSVSFAFSFKGKAIAAGKEFKVTIRIEKDEYGKIGQ
jgi:hypothetical protein